MKLLQKPSPANSLADFDLDYAAIAKIFRIAHAERKRLPGLAPSNAAGITFYWWVVIGLRKHLLKLRRGWAKRNINGLEVVEHAERRIRIAYVSVEGASVQDMKSSPRGPRSVEAAEQNGQLRLRLPSQYFEQTPTKMVDPSLLAGGFQTWFLAVEPDGEVYRASLALPTGVDPKSGRFEKWDGRIYIADVPIDSEPNDEAAGQSASRDATTPPKPKRRHKARPPNTRAASDVTKTGTDSKK